MNDKTAAQTQHNQEFRPLEEMIKKTMERLQVPGVAVGMIHEGKEYAAGFGVTNVEHPLPVDSKTLFQVGSITKTVTGTAAMRLVEMGLLDLDQPLRIYLPDLKLADEEAATKVTMRHLLTHTAGWPGDYFDDTGRGDDALARIVANMVRLPQLTEPGAFWGYNNAAFYLAGRIIEVLTGKTYEEAVKELVLDTLGMSSSCFFAEEAITHRVAVGHTLQSATPEVARPWALPRAAHPAGGLVSCVTDLLRYLRFHMGVSSATDGESALTAASIAQMQMPQLRESFSSSTIGLTWWLREIDGARTVEHSGATMGQQASLLMVPAMHFAIIILTNATSGGQLCEEVTQWALRHYLTLSEPEIIPFDLPVEQLAPYVGQYSDSFTPWEVSMVDGRLMLQILPSSARQSGSSLLVPLAFCGKDRVLALDTYFKDTQGDFLRAADGQIKWLRFAGRIAARHSAS
ncbi:MAG TPA: serine hydrolase domain-containing protein [Ktedonobacteraceae bacterium]|nr:serine hydrolase domain-containing protein [Ktedonobacteraceae bacterium]